ncbi:MAG: methyltransferase domain-containing protein [Candidatus Eisenbacteria bacterium]|uniref:Methyltransferase domain-containing protein n=1 Tax=Eiseniibacteriota bacterium TaxID=2212470 RepID=A0A933WAM6_UNCEI|nr:methyltransferase domain-containing protein [Candidatus Eisenbacteria bacterium]
MRDLLRRFPAAMPYKFKPLRRHFGDRPFDLLDIGAGNHSATRTKHWFPACRYSGVDRDRAYHNDAADFARMEAFYELDLTTLRFEAIPDGAFDVVMMAHVVEHLENGDDVVKALCPKLRPGGLFYLEFPSPRSLTLPSMRGTLNFHDDDTHVRLWTRPEIERALEAGGLRIVRSGVRRDLFRLAMTPVRVAVSFVRHGWVPGSAFWDLLGFADRILAEKPRD